VEDVQFVTRGAVTAVDLLLVWLWWIRRREWLWKCEEDDYKILVQVYLVCFGTQEPYEERMLFND
jgi:hypothetical protein